MSEIYLTFSTTLEFRILNNPVIEHVVSPAPTPIGTLDRKSIILVLPTVPQFVKSFQNFLYGGILDSQNKLLALKTFAAIGEIRNVLIFRIQTHSTSTNRGKFQDAPKIRSL